MVTAIRLTASAWCIVHREAPTAGDIARLLADDDKTAWLMENATRARPRDAEERHAIKEIAAWYKQERRLVETAVRMASGRLHYRQRGVITHLVKDAADKAGERGQKPLEQLEQLEHGSAKPRDVARNLGVHDPGESTAVRESASVADELVSALETETERPGADGTAIKRVAWCARQALHRSRKKPRR